MKLSNADADIIFENIIDRTKHTLGVKAKEYVRNDDRMHNFNVGATKSNTIRERVIESFRLKHEISRDDLINDLEKGIIPTIEYVSEKYGDIINYFILEEMSITAKINEINKLEIKI